VCIEVPLPPGANPFAVNNNNNNKPLDLPSPKRKDSLLHDAKLFKDARLLETNA
jgi:hypothetical protein